MDTIGIQESLIMDRIPKNVMRPRPIKKRGKHIPATAIPGTNCARSATSLNATYEREKSAFRYRECAKLAESTLLARIARKRHESSIESMTVACYGMLDSYVLVGIVTFANGVAIWQPYSPVTCKLGAPRIIPGRTDRISEDDIRELADLSKYDKVQTCLVA